MIKGKKGALELSVNTIVVIVIGVTLLTLGLVFVRQVLTQAQDLSGQAFEEANRQLDSLGGDINDLLTVSPGTVRIKSGDTSGFTVLIKNIEQRSYSGVVANIRTSNDALSKGVECEFSDNTKAKSLRSPLGSGVEERLNVRVKTSRSSIGSFGCELSLTGGGIEQTTYSIRRDVEIIVR